MVVPDDHTVVAQLTAFERLTAGAVAGGTAKSIIAPADRVKILYQVNPTRRFTLWKAIKSGVVIVRNSGFRGLWRGHGATLIRVMPYSAISFATFERYHAYLIEKMNGEDVRTRFFAGAMAGITAVTLTYPLDLMRARMAAHWDMQPRYSTYSSAFRVILEREGFRAMWNGLSPTLLGIIPYAGLSFATFETLKSAYKRRMNLQHDREIPTIARLFCGGIAGLLAQSVTYPLDIARRRMQVAGVTPHKEIMYKGTAHAIRDTFRNEGLAGLYKGLSMNWLKGPIAVSASFVVNDHMKTLLMDHRDGISWS